MRRIHLNRVRDWHTKNVAKNQRSSAFPKNTTFMQWPLSDWRVVSAKRADLKSFTMGHGARFAMSASLRRPRSSPVVSWAIRPAAPFGMGSVLGCRTWANSRQFNHVYRRRAITIGLCDSMGRGALQSLSRCWCYLRHSATDDRACSASIVYIRVGCSLLDHY